MAHGLCGNLTSSDLAKTPPVMAAYKFWPHGQAVKTPPFHGGIRGSNPRGVTKIKKSRTSVRLFLFQHIYPTLCYIEFNVTRNEKGVKYETCKTL